MDNLSQSSGFSAKIVEYITARGAEKLIDIDKKIDKLKASANQADQLALEQEEQKRRELVEKFKPKNWLSDAAKRAGQLQLVTHAPKYTHSDAKANGAYVTGRAGDKHDGLIDTSILSQPAIDVIGNAAALDVGKLLQLECDGEVLIEQIAKDDISALMPIAGEQQLASDWLAGLKKAIEVDKIAAHKLVKQVYWPVVNDFEAPEYHLLAPLFSSALQQEIYHTITSCNFSELAKEAKKAKLEKKYSDTSIVNFDQVAEQHFGGTKPQNISQLNSSRYGKAFLLNCAGPEQWQSVKKPPLNIISIFDSTFSKDASKAAHKLRRYLENVFERRSVMEIRDERAERIDHIIDLLFAYVAEVHQFEPGWSALPECKLPIEEQLLLDPLRRETDEGFEYEWDKKEWPRQVAERFSRWLNRHIEGPMKKSEKLAPGQVEYVQWRGILKNRISQIRQDFSDFYIDDKDHKK